MMKYRLKDQKRQWALGIALPYFRECLDTACSAQWNDSIPSISMECEKANAYWLLTLSKDEIEAIQEYDPKAWNRYPDVTPPDGVWMRVDRFVSNGREQMTHRESAVFRRGCWRDEYGTPVGWDENDEIRFRPWADEEGEE